MKARLGVVLLGLLGATGCAGTGTLQSRIYLPVTETERPTVSNEQVCQQVMLDFMVENDKTVLAPVTVGGPYEAQSHSCSFKGQWPVGAYTVRAYYKLENRSDPAAEPQATWTPPMASPLDKIQAREHVVLTKDSTTSKDFRLTREQTMTKPGIKLPEGFKP